MERTATEIRRIRSWFYEIHSAEYQSGEMFERFLAAYPAYASTLPLSRRRAMDFPFLDTYLDWAGAAKIPRCLLAAHTRKLRVDQYANPHSESRDSLRTTTEVEQARAAVLEYFGATPEEYTVIFTCNTTGALRLVGESYPFGPHQGYVYLRDNHNSVLGIREYAHRREAEVMVAGIHHGSLRLDGISLEGCLNMVPRGLFVFPAQSNFSGVQHCLDWIPRAQRTGWDVLLDASAFVTANRLDLGIYKPQFVALSFYKMFGYPTGIGCLIARHEALEKLERPWFAGGTIGGWHVPAQGPAAFEDGTVDFLGIPAVTIGLTYLETVGLQLVHDRCKALTGWLLEQFLTMCHTNGRRLVELYGPGDTEERGATITFNFRDPDGRMIDERVVIQAANKHGISLRTGCFCNPGCGEVAFGVDEQKLAELADPEVSAEMTIRERLDFLGLESGGAIRVSLGGVSTFADVEQFLRFAGSFCDATPTGSDLPVRTHC